MTYYIAEIRFNRNKSKKSEKKEKKRKQLISSLVTLTLISLLISALGMFVSVEVIASEPSLASVLNDLGFTNIALTDIETFSPGTYNATLYAEFASYYEENELSYYAVDTSDFQTLFTGPEGAAAFEGGYVEPPISKSFKADSQFGLSLLSPEQRYFTEHGRNPDYPEQHANVYINLDSPNMFLIGFENKFGESYRDHNDMVFSLVPLPARAPIPVLIYSPSIVYTGVVVDFDASASYDPDGSIVSYHWDFSDGNTASGATVSHLYVDDGEYPVTLRVVDNEGQVGSKVAIQVVKNRPPIAALTESATIFDTEEIVTFDASLSYDLDGTIVKYFWNFGDGTTATGVSVSHSYPESGVYKVTLTVTDDDGATDTIPATKIVRNKSPVAIFTESAETVYVNETITFNAADSYDPDGSIVNYSWDLGDGNTATGITTSHAYSDNGFYLMTLTVTDNDGATASAHATKTVMNRQPVASFTETAETVDTDETISFDASESSDPEGSIVNYSWDFGDGTKGTGVSVQHAYSQDGTYTVTLTVTDDDGAKDTAQATKTVHNRSPIASFTESAETVSSDESTHFDASESHDPDGTIVSYSWDFGDGNTATGVEVDHAYEDDGVYTVTLTVIDEDDATGSAITTKNVLNRPPIASFTENAKIVKKDEAIHFDASESHDPDGTIVNYLWDFGDGNTTTGVTSDHAYSEDGNYTVTLTVTDDDGASASLVAAKIVETETETEIETALPLAVISVIVLGVMALTATLLYGLFIRRKKKKKKLKKIPEKLSMP